MTVKEPWKIGWGVAKGRATLVLRASVYLLGKQDLRNPTASLETPLCLSVSKGEGTLCLSPLGLRQRCPSSLLMDVIPPPYQGEALSAHRLLSPDPSPPTCPHLQPGGCRKYAGPPVAGRTHFCHQVYEPL